MLKSVKGVTTVGARDQVVKPVLQCLLSGQMTAIETLNYLFKLLSF